MRGTVLYGPGGVRFEDRESPKIIEPTDAVIRIAATCVSGSDLWPYRGLQPIDGPTDATRMLHLIEQLGSDELLMFSSDYPHWHFDSPGQALPAGLPPELRRMILADNARNFYRLTK